MRRNCDAFGSLQGVDTTYYSNACPGQARITLMEHPSIMSRNNNWLNISLRLTAIALAASVAGCGMNPFSDDDQAPAPVQRSTSAPSGSTSMDAGNNAGHGFEHGADIVGPGSDEETVAIRVLCVGLVTADAAGAIAVVV